jgi:bifunctional non-homologous end joining protein LigD
VPPINAPQPPSGEQWLHEIKHDGFRIIARKDGKRVRLYSRPGNDLTYRFPLVVEVIAKLRSLSCIIDGEAVACGEDGIASFDRCPHNFSTKHARKFGVLPRSCSADCAGSTAGGRSAGAGLLSYSRPFLMNTAWRSVTPHSEQMKV